MNLKQALGRRIKTLRELRRMDQSDLAAAIDRSLDAVSMIERGVNWPSFVTIERLCRALDITWSDLFDDLGHGERSAPNDPVTLARHLVGELGKRELDVAVATLEALVRQSPRRPKAADG
ncbi:MAG: helix-turn-helix domain-containing protein [Rhizobiaceae bacterium]|nr:helix-turn-helix domain-containing protein [Rhizobiaceae bacterium]